jgi:hypothetical protein
MAEPRVFEALPQGVRANEAPLVFDRLEIDALKQQAIGQVTRFEVLGMKDVEALSKVRFYPRPKRSPLTYERNSVPSMSAATISGKHTTLFGLAVTIYTNASAHTWTRHVPPNFRIHPCLSRKKH